MADGKGVTVLFLGSGFTRGMEKSRKKDGVATQKDFLEKVLDEKWKKRVNACGLEINSQCLSAWMLKVKDPEVCMSHLHNLAYSDLAAGNRKDRNAAKMAIINFRSAIREYLHVPPTAGRGGEPRKVKIDRELMCKFKCKFGVKEKIAKNKLVILTTNYDLVAEEFLCDWKHRYPEIPGKDFNCHGGTPLYKLHGSMNWMEKRKPDGDELIGIEPLYVHDATKRSYQLDRARKRSKYWVYKRGQYIFTPILIPFFFQKEDWLGQRWSDIFHRHWASAARCLEKKPIDEIIFIGYRLPPADTYMMSWLIGTLERIRRKEGKAPRIKIIHNNPCGELIEKALEPYKPDVCSCGLRQYLNENCR